MRRAAVGPILALVLVALARPASGCPACAVEGGGTPGWWIALLLLVPLVAAVIAAVVVRRVVARGRR